MSIENSNAIKIGLVGYGNLSKAILQASQNHKDILVSTIFTRRNPKRLKQPPQETKLHHISILDSYISDNEKYFDKENITEISNPFNIDVLILCGGSMSDLPEQTPKYARFFNVIDSYDNHNHIQQHYKNVDIAASKGQRLALISIGWDPGLFSLFRLMFSSILPDGKIYTFWGPGISQGHSDAIRQIEGVVDARQYTIPLASAINRVQSGENPDLCATDRHLRKCYVVAKESADKDEIAKRILNMPDYFQGYKTEINFITKEELDEKHASFPHKGRTILSESNTFCELKVDMASNPKFTANILLSYAKACHKMFCEGQTGCKTIFDVPVSYLNTSDVHNIFSKYL